MIIHFNDQKDFDLRRLNAADHQLISAIIANDVDGFKDALKHGADVDTHEGLPVIAAVYHQRSAMVKELYEHEANFSIAAQSLKETTNNLYGRRRAEGTDKVIAHELYNLFIPIIEKIEIYRTGLDNIMMRRQANAFNKVAEKVDGLEQKFETIATLLAPQQISKKGLDR